MNDKTNGYNPMLWDCNDPTKGCYNLHQRPKIEVFSECFGGRINFGDLDASIVEVNYRALILEWKSGPIPIPAGQDIMYRNLTKTNLLVVVTIAGDAYSMRVTHSGLYVAGKFTGWTEANLDKVKEIFRRWYERARSLPPLKLKPALPHQQLSKGAQEWVADYEAHEHDFSTFV